jgi:hypothetical protein
MIKERTWPVRAVYILIAAALAISLMITAAPAHKVSANTNDVDSEWDKVPTPTTEDWVLAPESYIVDYAVGDGGDVAYAILSQTYDQCQTDQTENPGPWYLLKSTDGAATWKDLTGTNITKGVKREIYKKHLGGLSEYLAVACDADDPDFLAVALSNGTALLVFLSDDGGDTFKNAGEVNIPINDTVFDLEVSPAVAGDHEIAIGGTDGTKALLFRTTATGTAVSGWEDATAYPGWDNKWAGDTDATDDTTSGAVVDIQFSPSWKTDKTILAVTVDDDGDDVYLQSGTLGDIPVWNKKSSLSISAVPVKSDVHIADLGRFTAGVTLPSDYSSKSKDTRYAWVWVNYRDDGTIVGQIFRVKDTSVKAIGQQIEDTKYFLTDVSYWGTIAEGKAIAGVLGDGLDDWADCCDGVQVYSNVNVANMDICCIPWESACKPPTGINAMDAFYVSDDKAYAVALGPEVPYDEGAWSVSFDDGYTWNQLSLIDTTIDYLSDVAVSPDCNKIMLVSVNLIDMSQYCECCECTGCDSVWVYAKEFPEAGYDEYSGHWLRTWCGQLEGDNSDDFDGLSERGLLRLLPASEETNGDTVYLVDRMTDTIYLNDMETLSCWTTVAAATVHKIVDLAVKDADTLYALNNNGDVALYDDEGWHDSVDSKVDEGWTIAVHGEDILVGGGDDGQVSYSDDGGETFTELEDVPTIDGYVTVAFDSYFDTNKVVYAATAWGDKKGIYRWVIDESDEWKDLNAEPYDYTGLVLGFQGGNPFSDADKGGVLYASYVGPLCNYGSSYNWYKYIDPFDCFNNDECWGTGVARCLTPAGEISCEKCIEWDYLTVGLHGSLDDSWTYFYMAPQALKICGCTDFTSNTKLFAIGLEYNEEEESLYDMCKAKWGTVWTFEDCYAKKAPEVTSDNNATIPADCWCNNLPFSLKWDAVCDACVYDVQIALDDKFTDLVTWEAAETYTEGGKDTLASQGLSFVVPGELTCEVTYYWRIRAHQADTCQVIHSWWSDTQTFTVAPSKEQGAIDLIAPEPSATNVAIKNVGFSWDLLAVANKFDWKLSANADLSNPLDSQTLTTKAYTYTGPLSYDTTYYWQVIARKDSTLVSTSATGTFRTMEAPPTPVTPTPAPTPPWVWVVIAIGAILVIVVIVLIFRTRRV